MDQTDIFWEKATEIIDSRESNIIIIGDLNGRVGVKDQESSDVLGQHGEQVRNNNGQRIIDFCRENDLIIMNSFFQHKDVHKYTREVKSRGEKSIIDYVLVNRPLRQCIKEVRVRRGAEIYSDHYLVVSRTNIGVEQKRTQKVPRKRDITPRNLTNAVIRSYKLADNKIAQKYKSYVNNSLQKHLKQNYGLEETWQKLKESLLDGGKQNCGIAKINKNRQCTNWWSNEIKEEVKSKKLAWKKYLGNQNAESYQKYKQQRAKVKNMVIKAKKKSWEDFGNKLEKDYHTNQKLFYKTLRSLRT
ncbi:uncharacterized protein [Diabrotica undecimpunctata]|uniref:uncharacterized protein n=1 Tax=Diabrotica undecimpunctata TaxID=50387 RepID=UPI003B63A34A